MLPMEPVAAAALIRALSWQFSRVFITADSQYGTSLSDSMALRCGWRSRHRGSHRVYGCCDQVLVAADYVELGPRLKRSNLEYVILQGSHFHRRKWRRALQRCSRRLGLVPRWTGRRLLLCPNDYFLNTVEVRSRHLEHIS